MLAEECRRGALEPEGQGGCVGGSAQAQALSGDPLQHNRHQPYEEDGEKREQLRGSALAALGSDGCGAPDRPLRDGCIILARGQICHHGMSEGSHRLYARLHAGSRHQDGCGKCQPYPSASIGGLRHSLSHIVPQARRGTGDRTAEDMTIAQMMFRPGFAPLAHLRANNLLSAPFPR